MKLQLLISCVLATSLSPLSVEAGIWDRLKSVFIEPESQQPPSIRVLVCHDASSAMVEVKGKYNVFDPYKNEKIATRFSARRSSLEAISTGIKWGEEFVGTYQLKIVPDDSKTRVVVNGIEYSGVLYVYDVGGRVSIVNEVDIEDYVTAVLSPLFDKPLSKEGMNAIAIAARTDAYHLSQHAANPFWHAQANNVGYTGYALKGKQNGVADAVRSTRYMVMSQSTPYSGSITTFSTSVVTKNFPTKRENSTSLSVDEVELLASKGKRADKILSQIFPSTTITLMHSAFEAEDYREVAEGPSRRPSGKTAY